MNQVLVSDDAKRVVIVGTALVRDLVFMIHSAVGFGLVIRRAKSRLLSLVPKKETVIRALSIRRSIFMVLRTRCLVIKTIEDDVTLAEESLISGMPTSIAGIRVSLIGGLSRRVFL